MTWKSVGKSAGSMGLKILGGALAGPAGVQVGGMVAASLGLSDATPEAVQAALAGDPEAAVKMRQFELEHEAKLQALALDELKAHLADTDSARAREVEVTKATGKRDWNQQSLGWIITAGFIAVLVFLLNVEPPEANSELLWILIGALMRDFGQIVQYNFGSSYGSATKTGLLARTPPVK